MNEQIPDYILKKSNLSFDEKQLIEYIRQHPEEKEKVIELLKKIKNSPGATNTERVYKTKHPNTPSEWLYKL